MHLWSVEHFLNISSTFFSSKLDSPSPSFWLEENLILPNVLITGESNIDEKNVEEMFKKCSTDQSCIRKWNTTYKIGTLVKDDAGRSELCWNVKGCAIVCLQLCDMVMNNSFRNGFQNREHHRLNQIKIQPSILFKQGQ